MEKIKEPRQADVARSGEETSSQYDYSNILLALIILLSVARKTITISFLLCGIAYLYFFDYDNFDFIMQSFSEFRNLRLPSLSDVINYFSLSLGMVAFFYGYMYLLSDWTTYLLNIIFSSR